jgi:hypothetical protein
MYKRIAECRSITASRFNSTNNDKNKLKNKILVLTFSLACSIIILVSYTRFCK